MSTYIIQSWNDQSQDNEEVEITENSMIKLGTDNTPHIRVWAWMKIQELSSMEELVSYIDNLDFNVQVVINYCHECNANNDNCTCEGE